MKDLIKTRSHLPRSAATKVAALCSGVAELLYPCSPAIGSAQYFMDGMAHIMRSCTLESHSFQSVKTLAAALSSSRKTLAIVPEHAGQP